MTSGLPSRAPTITPGSCRHSPGQLGEASGLLAEVQLVAGAGDEAGAVVPAVLQPAQALQQHPRRLTTAREPDDPAHGGLLVSGLGGSAAAGGGRGDQRGKRAEGPLLDLDRHAPAEELDLDHEARLSVAAEDRPAEPLERAGRDLDGRA